MFRLCFWYLVSLVDDYKVHSDFFLNFGTIDDRYWWCRQWCQLPSNRLLIRRLHRPKRRPGRSITRSTASAADSGTVEDRGLAEDKGLEEVWGKLVTGLKSFSFWLVQPIYNGSMTFQQLFTLFGCWHFNRFPLGSPFTVLLLMSFTFFPLPFRYPGFGYGIPTLPLAYDELLIHHFFCRSWKQREILFCFPGIRFHWRLHCTEDSVILV